MPIPLLGHAATRACCGLLLSLAALFPSPLGAAETHTAREMVAAAVTATSAGEQRDIILSLKSSPSPEVVSWLEKWKEGGIFIHEDAEGKTTAVILTGEPDASDTYATLKLSDGSPMLAADGSAVRINPKEVEFADTSSALR